MLSFVGLNCNNKLTTRDILAKWGIHVPLHCPICSSHDESLDHLFFHCPFFKPIWMKMLNFVSIFSVPNDFHQVIMWLSNLTRRTYFKSYLLALMFSTTICFIWRARNECAFQAKNTN